MLKYIKSLGIEVFSCDDCAREIYPRPEVQDFIRSYLSELPESAVPVYEDNGIVGKWVTRQLLVDHPGFKEKLEAITHPIIRAEMFASPAVVCEVPLLFEGGRTEDYEEIWVVACDEKEQHRRLTARLQGDAELARRWAKVQMPLAEKIAKATRVIWTNVPEETVNQNVHKMLIDAGVLTSR